MANWSNPTLTSTYTDFLGELKNRDDDLAKQFDGTTSSNLATGTIRWNSTTNRWQKWSGSAWAELTGTYALTALTTTGNATIGGTLAVTGATTLAAATATTPATGDNSTAVATTAYVRAQAYAPLASPALTGTPTVPTAAVDTNTTQAASTAFLLGQAGSTNPVMNGSAAVGSSLRYARQDHVHPVDTSRAPLASPTLTGTPAAPTAAAGTNTTQLATTAFVNAEIANDAPSKTGTGASGTWGISVSGNAATVSTNANLTGDVTSVGNATSIAAGVIVNADISASAAIVDTKLATISTAGKVSNSATTATDANTASAIVARDASGNFAAGDITIADKIIHASDTNTAIRFPAADTVTVETGGAERLRINSTGQLLMGPAVSSISTNGVPGGLQLHNYTNSNGAHLSIVKFNPDTGGGLLVLGKSKSATVAAGAVLANNDSLGSILFVGDDGTDLASNGASITGAVDGTPGPNDMPGRLVFSTTADGTAGSTEAMRINNAQELLIGYTADNGAFKLQVNSQIFATSATVATSDGRYKENVATLNRCIDLVNALRPVSFDWKPQQDITRIDEDGNSVLVREAHNFPDGKQVGFIAQEVREVLADKPWLGSIIKENVRPAIDDADGNELAPEEEFFGIAEGNLTAVLTAALQEAIAMISALETRIAALEA